MPRLAYLTAQIRAAYHATRGVSLVVLPLLLPATLPQSAQAAPVDPVVRAGTATFAINGNVYTVTNAPNTIIDWRQFNVANGELLRFLQQNPQSVVLNRVTGADPSQLFGTLQSNGRVILVNPNGVLFGPNANVDVAGLIASTLNLSDADFLAGRMAFNGAGGVLQNQGRITTPLGGSVFLIGGDVTNSGVITAPGGRILLAAGQSVSLADAGTPGVSVTLKADGNKALNLGELHAQGGSIDLYGALVDHQGIARADSAAVDAHGNVVLKATQAATVSGAISAANTAGAGGSVQVLGDSVALGGSARIDASGQQGGGTVLVGGDLKGANPAIPNARTATVAAGAQIDASATGNGDGGKVVVWSNDKTDFAGSIAARGGALGGNGGQVETSGKQLSFDQGSVNTLAPKGITGNWLLDPAVFCFYASSASECTGAAAAGATSFNTLGNILVSTGGTLQATDFITFLPSGGNVAVGTSIPAGITMNVLAPYIQVGNGSNINTRVVGLRLEASNAFGTTTQTGVGGANLTGTIDIGGDLTSNASQTLISTGGNINMVHGGTAFTALRMTSATGTQSLSTTGQLLLEAGSGNDAAGRARQTALFSDGAQTISASQLILRAGNSAGAAGNHTEISAKGNQTITATDITLNAGASGWAIISDNAAGATQTVKADRIAMTGGSAGTDNRTVIIATGNNAVQDITANVSLDITGGAGGVRNLAIIKSEGVDAGATSTQKITAGAIKVTGGGGANENYATIYTPNVQSVTAGSIAITGGNSGTATTGSAPYASISADSGQTVKVTGALSLTGGAGELGSSADLYSGGNQAIAAGTLSITGGASGKSNSSNVSIFGNSNVTQSITANSIVLQGGSGTDNFAGIHADGANITQTVTANTLTIKGGGGTASGNWAHLWFNDTSGANKGKQTITAGAIALTGGSGGTDQNAMIGGNADQKVTADAITLTGGTGVNAGGVIGSEGNQAIVVKNALTMTAGANDGAEARIGGSGTVDVSADTITLQGGSAGTNSVAQINAVNNVTINVSNAFNLTGGAGGTNNAANTASSANLTINAGSLAMTAGATGSGNGANLNSGAAMTVKVKNAFNLTAGAGGTGNSAALGSAGNQTLEAGALSITGGSGGSANHANISINGGTDTVQKVTAGAVTLQGGTGGTDNIAGLHANGTRVTQDITATGSLNMTAGNGAGNWAHVAAGYQDATPSTQRINAAAINLTGTTGTAANSAANALLLNYGVQEIKGGSLTLAGRLSSASVQNSRAGGTQSIDLTGAMALTGGQGNNASAFVTANGAQSIGADSITLAGGSSGTTNMAYISSSGDQALGANRVSLTGGGGQQNQAGIFGGVGKQTITIKGGGSLALQGGSGDALPATGRPATSYCGGCKLSSNGALIINNGGSQVVDFVSGGTLTLTGGTRGSDNAALLIGSMDNGGTQTVTSSGGAANYPVITLTGGSGSGFYNPADGANVGNVAALGAFDSSTPSVAANGLKTINAKSITLNGGGAANERGGALLAAGNGNSIVNVTGDLVMNGGSSSLAYVKSTNPAQAYWLDFGSLAGIAARGNVDLKVGGNLVIHGGTGSTSPAGILLTSGGKLTADIHGATRMDAGASVAGIGTGVLSGDTMPQAGSAGLELGTADSFTTSTFAASGKYFALEGAINVVGSSPDAQLVGSYSGGTINGPGWRALGAKPIVAEVYASDGIDVSDNAAINTPNGTWIAVLGKNAAASVGTQQNTLTYNALASHGYQWTPEAYNSSNAQDFRFILPDNSPIVETHADEAIAQAACTANPALCVTPPIAAATPASAVAPVVIDVKLTGGVDETPLSASLAQNKPETPPAAAAPEAKVQGPRVAAREREAARADEQKKSTADLKREAREANTQAKASQDAARKAALAAQKEAAEAKRLAAAAAKTEAQAVRATAAVGAAEGDLRAAEADARDARAALGAATTPALKNQAQLRLATAEAARAGAEAKLADARAKRAELGAQGSEAGARSAQADAVVLDARSREAAAEAKLADLAHKEALVRAREAKDPVSRAAAERLADDKRIEATQHAAESDVRKSFADDLRFAAEQGKAQADARQAQAQAAQALAQARRDEVRLQRAVARARQEEVLAGGKGGAGRTAQGGKEVAEKLVATETRRVEASQSAANAKAQAAEAKQRKADEGMAEVARRDATRRDRAVKAFVAGANASMTASQLAGLAALRHEYKGVLFKDALKVLEQNGRAADLPACGGNISNTCMPSFAQARMEWPTARPLVRKPVAASLPQIERKVAIVIGINDYADKRIPQLDTAVPDADAVAKQLETSMGYETRVLRNATKAEIVAALQGVARELDPNDSLVVYYAGHGYLRPVAKGPAQGYWIPADGAVSNPANWMSNSDVSKLLANIPAKQVMLVSDSCYSGAFSREQKVAASGDPSAILARRSVVVMSSGGEEPVSDEGVEGHSIFAWSLMQSMKKVGQVEPGSRVFDATREQVTAAYPQVPQYGAAVSAGHAAGGDYLFETRTYK
ncbi:filamentous hemagglutinin N-terminal domain-containing protein [Duganella sp. FT92W]|uniref:Filamentous hemagglutinin N-terminal domain-containing protein n=1 Tax=Pseudoduganella rivuli TaxID=2666085 RepID=A0A7X2IN62_9BURK|nr:caspase family protein [Pseudoduganella rivuli]MRV72823.1 filamentous hemagglutinin N-terminal domain-containing protein [Pseudoduganella rivuli]